MVTGGSDEDGGWEPGTSTEGQMETVAGRQGAREGGGAVQAPLERYDADQDSSLDPSSEIPPVSQPYATARPISTLK